MAKIKFDKSRMDERWDCPYKYEFRSLWHLEDDTKEPHGLENYLERDVRDLVFESNVKDFIIELRKRIYHDSVEEMIPCDLKDLMNTKRRFLK